MTDSTPSTKGPDGRGPDGRFVKGYAGGPGNPMAAKVAKLRSAALHAVTQNDMKRIIRKLVKMAQAGDVAAAREVFLRSIGHPVESDIFERLEQLEKLFNEEASNDNG